MGWTETLKSSCLETTRLSTAMPLFDVNLHIDPERKENVARYLNLCTQTRLMVTLSCFSVWAKSKKQNACAKVIPVVPIKHASGPNSALPTDVRVFFFDDNINLDDGSSSGAGICNLRCVLTGDYVDFSEGRNGFKRHIEAQNTLLHASDEYKAVLVQANILDAMADLDYFNKIIRKYSQPGETILCFMDVNSTVVCVDTVTNKSTSQILLGTLFEFIELQPSAPFELIWDERLPVKVAKPITLKQLVKNLAKAVPEGGLDEKKYYNNFYTEDACSRLITEVTGKANCKWCSKKNEDHIIGVKDFFDVYKDYQTKITDGANDKGITKSWFKCYEFLMNGGHSVTLNSFGTDTKTILAYTVDDTKDVLHTTANHPLWDARDQEKFAEAYGLSDCASPTSKPA